MSKEELGGIALLMIVSLAVRILPSLSPLPTFMSRLKTFDQIAPIAVLLNLGVFCVFSEWERQPLPAAVGFAALWVVFFVFRRINILLTLLIATLAFATASVLS